MVPLALRAFLDPNDLPRAEFLEVVRGSGDDLRNRANPATGLAARATWQNLYKLRIAPTI